MEKAPIPTLTDGPSEKGFYVGLYLEHLEECSFLYEQRLTLFDDPEIGWTDIADFEERYEAHIDALVIGQQLALDVCRMRAAEGDFGELHSALRVFCRQERMDYLQEALETAEPDDDTLTGITEALKHELPRQWHDMIRKMLLFDEADLVRIGAVVTGFKRLAFGDELLKVLQDGKTDPLPEVIHAIGRLGDMRARHLLWRLLNDAQDDRTAREIALALLRLDDPYVIENIARTSNEKDWPLILIGIAGNKLHVPFLHGIYDRRGTSSDLLLALGFLGDTASIPVLVENLTHKDIGQTAAAALNLITGANLVEEAFIPESIDPDMLFEDEREKVKQNQPLHTNGDPPGVYIHQLSQNPDSWQNWWRDNAGRFDPSLCYRNGKPFTTACILENLISRNSPHAVRKWAAEEWVIKTGKDLHFETDFPVSKQKKALAGIGGSKN